MKQLISLLIHYRTPTLILLLGVLITSGLTFYEYKSIQKQRDFTAESTLHKYAAALQSSLDQRLFVLDSLDAFMHSYAQLDLTNPEQEQRFHDHFDKFANHLHTSVDGILSIQLAPQGVIRYLTGGETNKKAIGYDLFEDDSRKKQIIHAIYEHHQVITGPIELIQGGTAIIARKALFAADSPNASAQRLREKLIYTRIEDLPADFWGLATVLFSTESLLEKAGLNSDLQDNFRFALKGRHGLGAEGELFWGEPSVVSKSPYVAPINFQAGKWLLSLQHTTGFPMTGLLSIAALGMLLTLLAVYAELTVSRNRRVVESERAKDAFLASMSHEIRSPLNGVVGLVSLLRKTTLSSEQSQLVNGIESSASQLSAVIGDILDFSKISAGKVELEYRPIMLGTLLQQCLDIVMPMAEKKAHTLRYALPVSLESVAFRTDETRFKQIVLNLLSNAIKFTDHGGEITLSAEVRHQGEQTVLNVTVSDNGIGMTESELSRLFHRFSQADASTTRKYGGTGLGLAISRQLAHLMGGELGAISVKHQGTDFTLQLPFEQVQLESANDELTAPSVHINHDIRILVVDDLPMNLSMMVLMLEKLGFHADTASNGLQAVSMQKTNHYDLIFMDWEMPELDGVEATKRIRKLDALPKQPWIIALTANASTSHKEACMRAGMNDYLAKPVGIDQIAVKMEQIKVSR